MKITFIGTGYVGLVSGSCFAELGQSVTCVDKDKKKIKLLESGKIPIFEPGLQEIVHKNRKSGRLKFSSSLEKGVKDAEVIFVAVGTPTDGKNGNADLSYVYGVADELAEYIQDGAIIVIKSTVPVGTGKKFREIVEAKCSRIKFDMVSNPEFLREGCAVNDFLYPDRVVIGTESERAKRKLEELYKPLTSKGVALLSTDIQTAELTKYAANAFLATKIAFINEIADMCEKTDANVSDLAKGIGLDHRIGRTYLSPGPGYGGSCFPKDTLALQYMARQWKSGEQIVSSVIASNDKRKDNMADKIVNALGGKLKDKTIAILGLAFKANTDDIRESPAIPIVESLLKKGASLRIFDPEAMEHAKKEIKGKNISYCKDSYDAMKGADACVIATEWAEFSNLDFERVIEEMEEPLIIDLRNLYNPDRMRERGVSYISIGRKEIKTKKRLSLVAAKKA